LVGLKTYSISSIFLALTGKELDTQERGEK
jgi:hypothetical protein